MQGSANEKLPAVGESQPGKVTRFRNFLRSSDSLTEGTGYINEVRPYQKDPDTTLYFVRIGLITGTEAVQGGEEGERKPVFQNCDLLVGSTLKSWAAAVQGSSAAIAKIRCHFKIRNLQFVPDIHEGNPVLNSRGVLETVQFGFLED